MVKRKIKSCWPFLFGDGIFWDETEWDKLQNLCSLFADFESLVVAFSGGVDSGTLYFLADLVIGRGKVQGVLIDSESLSRWEFLGASRFAEKMNLNLQVVRGFELSDPEYVLNGKDRCYHCKSDMVRQLQEVSSRIGISKMAYGFNTDDRLDFRPGHQAAEEGGVLAPLAIAGWDKRFIRKVARCAGLSLWDKPASPCLSSRILHGIEVTPNRLNQIERAETFVRNQGFKNFRVRMVEAGARLEIDKNEWITQFGTMEIPDILGSQKYQSILLFLNSVGFASVAFENRGLVSGGFHFFDKIKSAQSGSG